MDIILLCEDLGRRAVKVEGNEKALRQWARLFWFTIEFALVKTKEGNRIFGAGIASSYTECEYALSSKPEVIPFDIEIIRNQEFKIDDLQHRIFLLENPEQLYSCLEAYEKAVLNNL